MDKGSYVVNHGSLDRAKAMQTQNLSWFSHEPRISYHAPVRVDGLSQKRNVFATHYI